MSNSSWDDPRCPPTPMMRSPGHTISAREGACWLLRYTVPLSNTSVTSSEPSAPSGVGWKLTSNPKDSLLCSLPRIMTVKQAGRRTQRRICDFELSALFSGASALPSPLYAFDSPARISSHIIPGMGGSGTASPPSSSPPHQHASSGPAPSSTSTPAGTSR